MTSYTEHTVKHLRSGDFLAEVSVDLRYEEGKDYSPTLTGDDALRVERVAKALERGDPIGSGQRSPGVPFDAGVGGLRLHAARVVGGTSTDTTAQMASA